MHFDDNATRHLINEGRRRAQRRPWLALLSALLGMAEGKAELIRHSERGWSSATFTGSRHTIVLAFTGNESIAAGEVFLADLPDHEFTIPGQLVADAAIIRADHAMLPDVRLEVEVELLLLEDG